MQFYVYFGSQVQEPQESSGRRKTSKYFSKDKHVKDELEVEEVSAKRKARRGRAELDSDVKPPPGKKVHKVEDEDDDEDFVTPSRRESVDATRGKKLKSGVGKGVAQNLIDESDEDDAGKAKSNLKTAGRGPGGKNASATLTTTTDMDVDGSDKEDVDDKDAKSTKSGGRGRGGRGTSAGGRGGGGGRGGFMNFGERKDPPHKGEKVLTFWNLD